MKTRLITAALASALTITSAHAQTTTPESVKTCLGTLKFEKGFPTEETKRKVFDEIDYQRAVQAYLWAYPAVSFQSLMMAAKKDYGTDLNDFAIADNYVDSRSLNPHCKRHHDLRFRTAWVGVSGCR